MVDISVVFDVKHGMTFPPFSAQKNGEEAKIKWTENWKEDRWYDGDKIPPILCTLNVCQF